MNNKDVKNKNSIKDLPRNIWAVGLTSFFMDVSSEMVINILPLFLSNVLGVKTNIIGLIEGVAESTASILKIFSGWLSDKLHARKWLAVAGYGLSAISKPFFYFANSWGWVAGVRWVDRVGKGIRTAPRDALVADSIEEKKRGLAFGFHRAADTAGAMLGLLIALFVVWRSQSASLELGRSTFQTVVLVSLVPAFLAVLSLVLGVKEVKPKGQQAAPKFAFKALGKPFMTFMVIVGLFDLGNSSDSFLVLRAQERGISVIGILGLLAVFNLVYTLVSTPAGSLSDKVGRRNIIIGGWVVYALVYLGFVWPAPPGRYGCSTSSMACITAWLTAPPRPWWPIWSRQNCAGRHTAPTMPSWASLIFRLRSSRACSGRASALGRALVLPRPSCLGQLWLCWPW